MSKNKIEPGIILTIITSSIYNIPIIITDNIGNIITTTHIAKGGLTYYRIRKSVKETINKLINEYGVDTILMEQNQLFIDKIERYPDPYVLRNIQLGFGIKVTIEDNFWDSVSYIMEIPRWEWKKEILNSKVDYAIDLYKNHILRRQNLSRDKLQEIDDYNYYEALCFSECMLYDKFLHNKYQVNR